MFNMEQGPTVVFGLFRRLNILDKHRGAHLRLAGLAVTASPGALGALPGPPAGVVPVWDGLMAGTMAFSIAGANPVVAQRAQSLAVSSNVLKPSAS